MNNPTKDNHFNPKGYLKGFCNISSKIIRYKIKQKYFDRPKHYTSVGFQQFLYTQQVEDLLKKYDDKFVKAVNKVKCSLSVIPVGNINQSNLNAIADFIALQICRTPESLKRWENVIDEALRNGLTKYINKDHSVYLFNKYLFNVASKIKSELIRHTWILTLAPKKYYFVSSDNVIAITSTRDNLLNNLGISSPYSLKFFPIDQKICLIITANNKGALIHENGELGIRIKKIYSKRVKYFNGFIALSASDYIYSSNRQLIEEALDSAKLILSTTKNN